MRVAGMDCPDEIAAIERVLKPLAGMGEIKVNIMAGTATVVHDHKNGICVRLSIGLATGRD